MTTYSPFELEPIFIDFKNESYNLGLDIQANQNDTLTLNFIFRNNGIEEDMSKYKVELRVHNNNANIDYIQTQNENVTLSTDGSVKIVCQSLKGNKLTAYSGQCNGVLRIFNTENKQKATRIITMRIVADPLETDRTNICESTITKLEDLDWILNEAYNLEDEFKKAIEEAIKQKAELTAKIGESVNAKNNLNSTIQTANNTNNTLTDTNNNAVNTKNELNGLNNNAINTKSNLDKSNAVALVTNKTLSDTNTGANNTNNTLKLTISEADKSKTALDASKINADKSKIALDTSKSNADKSKSDLDGSISTGVTLKNDIDNRITAGNKLKTDIDNSSTVATAKKEQLDGANVQAQKNIETLNSFGNATDLTKDVTTLKTKVLENTLTSITTDNVLTKLDNSENGFVRNMQIRGKTLQNLVPKTVGEKTIITDGGQWQFFNIPKENILFKENTTYTFVVDIEEMSVENQFSLVLSENIDSDKGKIQTTVTAKNIGRNIIKANSYADFNSSTIKYDLRCYIYNPNKIKGSTVKFKFMILEGEVKEIPSYFEGIKSVGETEGNKISILTKSKNLCSINSLRFSKQENTGRFFKINKLPKGKYKLKYNGTDKYLAFYYYIEGGASFYRDKEEILTIQHDEYKELRLYIDADRYDDNSTRKYDDIVISRVEDGDFKYEPSKEDKTEILLPSPHCGLPDGVSDVVDFDKSERIKNVDKVIFDCSENWIFNQGLTLTNTVAFYTKINNKKGGFENFITNKFITKYSNPTTEDIEKFWGENNNQVIYIRINKSKLETQDLAGFKKWLQSNPITVYYQLATPVVEKLSIKDTLQTFQDGYIQLDNAITPTTSLEYSTNLPSALGGLTRVTDKLVDDITNVEITISDLDAELDEARKGKTTLEERLEDDRTNILKTIDKSMTRKDNQLIENGDLIQLLPSLKLDKLYTVTNNVKNLPNSEWFNMIMTGQDANSITVELVGLWSNRKWYLNRNTSGNSGWKQIATTDYNGFGKLYINPKEKDISDANSREFYVTNVTDNSNAPNDHWNHVINLPHSYEDGYTSQIAVSYGLNSNIYFRGAEANTWLPWKELATTENFTPTLLNGWKFNYSSTNIAKVGNSVIINLRIKDGNISNGTVLITGIPFKPIGGMFFPAYDRDGNLIGQVGLYENGELQITKVFTHNKDIILNLAYTVI